MRVRMFLAMAVFGVWTASVRGDAFYADTPIAVSLLKTVPDDAEVCGLHLSPIALDAPYSVVGLSLGGINSLVTHAMYGLQIAGIAAWGHPDGPKQTSVIGGQIAGAFTGTDRMVGIQVAGIFSGTDDMTGIQLSGLSSMAGNYGIRGVQIAGLLAQAETCSGFQMSLWNGAPKMCGVQIGLLNFAGTAEGGFVVQIGLVNGISRGEADGWSGMRILPVINAGW